MWINDGDRDYYLDEEKFLAAMSAPVPPLNMEDIIAIQRRLSEANDLRRDLRYLIPEKKFRSDSEAIAEFNRHLDELVASGKKERQ